jgi:S1-C subfamily serine protease
MSQSFSASRGGGLVGFSLIVITGSLGVSLATANGGLLRGPIKGFSSSREGLPAFAVNAWRACVLVEKRQLRCGKNFGRPDVRTTHGSGFVVSVNQELGRAVIVTNAHVVACEGRCRVRIGFGDSAAADAWRWSGASKIVSSNTTNDLAFIETEIPDGVDPHAALLAPAEHPHAGIAQFVAIGWPDLTDDTSSGFQPPRDHRSYVKRFSHGSVLFTTSQRDLDPSAEILAQRVRVIYHNAAVLNGSSGGPLVDWEGLVIGINTLIVGAKRPADGESSCARNGHGRPPECAHVAVAAIEVIAEYEQVYGSQTPLESWPVVVTHDFEDGAL